MAGAMLMSGCTPSSASHSIEGAWNLTDVPGGLTGPCSGLAVITVYSPDGTFTNQSAEQVLRGRYKATGLTDGRVLISVKYEGHNGKLNCQGLGADYVINNTPPEHYVKVNADELQICRPDPDAQCFYKLRRMNR